jgi:hypothetical protein
MTLPPTHRRSVLQAMMSLPTTSYLARVLGLEAPPDTDTGPQLAVRILRFVNTAEHWHKSEFGRYAGRSELLNSPAVGRLKTDGKAAVVGLEPSLVSLIPADYDRPIQGWQFQLELTGGQRWRWLPSPS